MKKKLLIILVLLIVLVSILGVSYANWLFTGRQKDFNTLGSKCFELTMMNETEGVTLDKTYPISDEEGMKTKGYTFTIKNTCNTYATYEVNLEDMLVEEKRLSGKYIKVSINDGKPINLKELEEKEPTIEESDKAYELTSGSLGPEEETTYTIKLWMDESTPALEETMNATFLSKVSIKAGYIPEENLENEIILEAKSITESLNNKSEIFEITGTSTNYNLIEYSLNNLHWNRIESPSKNIDITEEFTEEGKYTIYVRDEVGNIKSIEFETEKLDKTVPEIKIEETDNQESIELNITFTDNEGLSGYAITESSEEPTEWNEISGKETSIKYILTENTTYYIWVKDIVGNLNYQMYSTDTIDTQAPELTISNTLTEWGTSDTITIQATDDVIGISGISISTTEDTYNWEVIENTLSYETTKEITENGIYYISVRDGYGHITTKSIVIDKVDNIAPILSDIQNSSNGAWAKSITLSWEITEEESGLTKVEYSTDNLIWTELSKEEWNGFTRNNERNDTIYIRVTDEVGNVSEIKSTTMKIDNTIPSATWNIGNNVYGNNGWYQSLSLQSTIKDSYGEIAAVRYCTTTGSTCTPNVNASISNNTFTVTLESNTSPQKVCTEVIDKAGNTSGVICSSSYSVDTTNPTVTISASVSGNAITVQATGSDAHSGIASYQYSRDNSTWYTGTSGTYNFTGLSYGNYIIYVKVIDYSGRVSNIVEMPVNVSIDAVSLIQSLANNGQLMYDGTVDNNLRYVGANPNNYINFNNELWRIVGVMNNINDGYGSINSRIKIVRDTPIGNLNWDSSISTINNGYGVNEWSQADLMLLLNTGAYWNRTSGNCYVGINNMVTTCDYTTQGLTTEAKKYIGTTLWNVGANGGTYGWNNVSASNFYMLERGSYTGKQCSATPSCNDNVSRTVTWLGKIGLIYPSDYAYATSGGATTSRNSCLNMVMYDWKNFNDCYQNNWLNLEQRNPVLWTLMPLGVDNGSQQVYITADGGISTSTTGVVQEVLPTLYLTPGVRVASGDGSETNPYVLTL